MKSTALKLVLSLVIISCAGCKHTPTAKSSSETALHGTPIAGKIEIVILGDVKSPGPYSLTPPVSLANVIKTIETNGGWGGQSEFGIKPTKVVIESKTNEASTYQRYTWGKMSQSKLEAIILKNGDIARFPRLLF